MNLSDRWFIRPKPKPDARLRLFCFPHAGGGSVTFYPWQADISSEIELCPVALPGRETRLHEASCRQLCKLAEALADQIPPLLDRDFAFFGHSIGSWVSFELARTLRNREMPAPSALFVSGNYAPHLHVPPIRYDASDSDFIDELQRLFNGFPRELLDDPDYLELFLPAVRADIEMLMTYRFREGPPLDCNITAFGGMDDPWVGKEGIQAWATHTSKTFGLHMVPGDHFYINEARRRIIAVIGHSLSA